MKVFNLVEELEKERKKNKELEEIISKTNWWLKEMLKTATNDETKAIISGALELLLKGDNK
jgi:hypothetical protein